MNNPNPVVYRPEERDPSKVTDPFITEIFDLIRDIRDPEHPHTLEELNVVREECITVQYRTSEGHVITSPAAEAPGGGVVSVASSSSSTPATCQQCQEQGAAAACDVVWIRLEFTPTVPHCSLATLIGLCLRVKLERCLGQRCKLDISVGRGSHSLGEDVNKQINDKERVAAAMENPHLRDMVEQCIKELEF